MLGDSIRSSCVTRGRLPMIRRPVLLSFALLVSAPLLSGCVMLAATGLVAGVSAARQERTVGAAIDDVRMKTEIQRQLGLKSASNYLNVSTTVVEGRVLLTGRVDDPQMRLDATRTS